jgi:hypothetical protein
MRNDRRNMQLQAGKSERNDALPYPASASIADSIAHAGRTWFLGPVNNQFTNANARQALTA